MLRYIYAEDLPKYPRLHRSMFADRAAQFRDRLAWAVSVDDEGLERDEYDAMNPLYVIWQQDDGSHGGSMRFLPTTGATMVNDHFADLTGAEIRHPLIWECTRFCLTEGAAPQVSAALLLGGLEIGLGFHLTDAVGVFDARMVRIYRRLGWSPTVLGTRGQGRDAISVGLWAYHADRRAGLLQRAGIAAEQSREWFAAAFDPGRPAIAAE